MKDFKCNELRQHRRGVCTEKVVHCWDKSTSTIADISASASAFSIVKNPSRK
jgi:hypothetical protein